MRTLILLLIFINLGLSTTSCQQSKEATTKQKSEVMKDKHSQKFSSSGLKTNTDKISIPFNEILSGGPAKDGIPALTNPKFNPNAEAKNVKEKDDGILLQHNGESKFYPYTILVWHEIANDVIGGVPVTITFCPLCGSAIVFESTVNDTVYEFGVSGRLWQSNMLMYDRTTETLWSQIEGRAVVGDLLDTELQVFPSQLVTYKEALAIAPDLQVLSNETGFNRNYGVFPYGDYDLTEKLYFPINHPNEKLPAKTLMVASTINGEAVAFHRGFLTAVNKATLETASGVITATASDNGEIQFTDSSGKQYPTYVTMWFSWANHNKKGLVWTRNG